ncbi:MAG: 50S ribosomal protein L17 [Candidatus Gracilibacteria bacterium]|nr:50S ribosomal protein L17 [Candidatus Gracilibacteria bacterium]
MRHRKNRGKLGRKADHRKALLRNLATSFALHGKLTTTVTKARALIAYYERLITLAKRADNMNAIRMIQRHLFTIEAQKAFIEQVKGLDGKNSGYLRLTKLGYRDGDVAHIAQVELS